MKNVKVIIWGLGAMGGGIANMLLKKKGVDIVGAVIQCRAADREVCGIYPQFESVDC